MEKSYFKEYYIQERSHWWFLGRLEILESLLKNKIIGNKTNLKILNVGVATGATSTMLEKYGELTSLEYDKDCCDFLRETVKMEVVNGSMTELPFADKTFDIVCAFDVIEHIKEDAIAMQEARRVLKDDGSVFIAVPMHMHLWSDHDVINHHFRRYNSKELHSVTKNAGFDISYATFFNSFLYLPIALVRIIGGLVKRKKDELPKSDFDGFNANSIVNKVLIQVLKIEKMMINAGVKFPIGVSKIIIGKKAS